ncbi:MAG: HPr family phosphocarrier protein [Salinispira sp.]
MVRKEIVLENANGLHMRPGRLFVQEAKKQACKVSVIHRNVTADAKSLVKLLKMGIGKGHSITLVCEGEGEQKSLNYLETFISSLEG